MSSSIWREATVMSISSALDAERVHQRMRVGLGELRRRKARQRVAKNVLARQAEPIERAGRDDQRVRGVEAAGDAEHDLVDAGGAQPRHQAVDLDVERLVAALVEQLRIIGHERKAVDRPLQGECGRRATASARTRRVRNFAPRSA